MLIAHLLPNQLDAQAQDAQAGSKKTEPLDLPNIPQLQNLLRNQMWDDNINNVEKGSRNRHVGKNLKQMTLLDA